MVGLVVVVGGAAFFFEGGRVVVVVVVVVLCGVVWARVVMVGEAARVRPLLSGVFHRLPDNQIGRASTVAAVAPIAVGFFHDGD